MKPVIAIVGRPNVGKSALFNRLVGRRVSIVEDTPGVTRDRIYADIEWRTVPISLIDTGGIEPESKDELLTQMKRQAMLAVDLADVIIFVGDIQTGVTAADMAVADMLHKSKKPIVLAVNKVDKVGAPPPEIYEFYNLGMGEPIAVSAVQSLGLGDILDAAFEHLLLIHKLYPNFTISSTGIFKRISCKFLCRRTFGKQRLKSRIIPEISIFWFLR